MIVVELQTVKSDHEARNCVENDPISWYFVEISSKAIHHERVKQFRRLQLTH